MVLRAREKAQILKLKQESSIYAPFADVSLFSRIVNELAKSFKHKNVTKVVGIEARGFILASAIAYKLKVGFVPIRKEGKMFSRYKKGDVYRSASFKDYSKERKRLELICDQKILSKKDRVLIIDDWFETGAQARAAINLIEKSGAKLVGIGVMLDQMEEKTREFLVKQNFHALVRKAKK